MDNAFLHRVITEKKQNTPTTLKICSQTTEPTLTKLSSEYPRVMVIYIGLTEGSRPFPIGDKSIKIEKH